MVAATMELRTPLQRIDVSGATTADVCGPDGCGCGHGAAEASVDGRAAVGGASTSTPSDGATVEFGVVGMTCAHCVANVTEELSAVPGVREVEVTLVPGAVSVVRVRSAAAVDHEALRAAVVTAGYSTADDTTAD